MAAPSSLDIPNHQIIINFDAADPNFPYHHRVLLVRVRDAQWCVLTPDLDRHVEDLDQVEHYVVPRATRFPAYAVAAGLYHFDPLPAAVLKEHIRLAKQECALLGGDVAMAGSLRWRFSEPGVDNFSNIVDQAIVDDVALFVELDGHGIAQIEGVVHRAELVDESELETWKKDRLDGLQDARLCAQLPTTFSGFVSGLVALEQKSWKFEGPRVCEEWLRAIGDGAGNLVSYHAEWVRLSGVSESSAQCHEHKQICEILRLGIHTDGLQVCNLAAFEQLSRRMVQLELAVAKNPRHPDFTGLHVLVDGAADSSGAARAPKFSAWVTTKQKEQAEIYKQRRLYAEEEQKVRNQAGAGASAAPTGAQEGEGGGRARRAPRPKPKAKAKAQDA